MGKLPSVLIDSAVAGGLVLALLLVVGLDSGAKKAGGGNVVVLEPGSNEPSGRDRPLRIAVTPTHNDKLGKWDDMGKLLDQLGEGYRYTMFPIAELLDPDRRAARIREIDEIDVLFLTCAPGGIEEAITETIKGFVARGGTLYASDWRYRCVAQAFPDFRAPGLEADGRPQQVNAKVLDPGLRDILGPSVPLKFDLSKWKPAAFRGPRVSTLIEGEYQPEIGLRRVAPLLVKFPFGKGTVIFTSFHNEKQNSKVEEKLLRYLVFSAVTARVDNLVNAQMMKGGFSPQKSNLLSASSGSQEVVQSYQSKNGKRVRFTLGFENRGARLKLSVTAPDGKTTVEEADQTFYIEQPNTRGTWQYTVTAIRVPYQDFPFTLTIGESD
ncbi:MAG: hypothetical protein FJ271_24180 [Planctomycetes bacterium]|nr:hypothetical protein [Planctomycetota bacterium]